MLVDIATELVKVNYYIHTIEDERGCMTGLMTSSRYNVRSVDTGYALSRSIIWTVGKKYMVEQAINFKSK